MKLSNNKNMTMKVTSLFTRTTWFGLLFILLISCSERKEAGKDQAMSINVLQIGKTFSSPTEIALEKKPFTILISFPEIPAEADTNISIHYWASTDARLEAKFKNAPNIDSVSRNTGGINVSMNNKDEVIVTNMQYGHKGLELNKKGSTKDVTHSFTNLQRVENRIDAYYKVSKIYDALLEKYIPIDSLTDNNLYIYYALMDNKTFKQSEGHYIHIKFK